MYQTVGNRQVLKYNGSSWAPVRQITLAVAVAVVHHLNIQLYYTPSRTIDTTQGPGGYSDASTNIGNVTINNAASNSCSSVDFGGNYNPVQLNSIRLQCPSDI